MLTFKGDGGWDITIPNVPLTWCASERLPKMDCDEFLSMRDARWIERAFFSVVMGFLLHFPRRVMTVVCSAWHAKT